MKPAPFGFFVLAGAKIINRDKKKNRTTRKHRFKRIFRKIIKLWDGCSIALSTREEHLQPVNVATQQFVPACKAQVFGYPLWLFFPRYPAKFVTEILYSRVFFVVQTIQRKDTQKHK
jgi:hypothetical protein